MTSTPFLLLDGTADQPGCRLARATAWLVAGSALVLATDRLPAQARDRVIVRQVDGRGRLTHVGQITDYNADEIVVKSRGRAAPWKIPAERIVSVIPAHSAPHLAARKHLQRGAVTEAEQSFRLALEGASRAWVRRELLAGLVRCALHGGDYRRAGSHFLGLAESARRTRHFELVPLDWRISGTVDPSVASEAKAWRVRSGDVAALLAASHLLRDSGYAVEAESQLRKLRISPDPRVRGLAVAQCWRADMKNGKVTPRHLDSWTRHIRKLPLELRGGPRFVIGLARLQRRQFQPAASALMWTSLVFDDDRFLAARATQLAANSLLSDNQASAAQTLYRDLQQRFAGTPAARESAVTQPPPPRTRRTTP